MESWKWLLYLVFLWGYEEVGGITRRLVSRHVKAEIY
jgi:hypothetical protein